LFCFVKNDCFDIVNDLHYLQFKSHFRVSRETSELLINMFEQSNYCPQGPPSGGKTPKTGEEHILVFLW